VHFDPRRGLSEASFLHGPDFHLEFDKSESLPQLIQTEILFANKNPASPGSGYPAMYRIDLEQGHKLLLFFIELTCVRRSLLLEANSDNRSATAKDFQGEVTTYFASEYYSWLN